MIKIYQVYNCILFYQIFSFKNLASELLDGKSESSRHLPYDKGDVMDIAAVGGVLYDDLIRFSERLLKLREKLDDVREDFDHAVIKLKTGKGNIVGKAEKLKNLGTTQDSGV